MRSVGESERYEMSESKIQWTDKTWNPTRGCKPKSPGCANCYAQRQAWRIGNMQPASNYGDLVRMTGNGPRWNGVTALATDKIITAPLRWRNPCMVFVDSMSDLFYDRPFEHIAAVLGIIYASQRQIWLGRAHDQHPIARARRCSVRTRRHHTARRYERL